MSQKFYRTVITYEVLSDRPISDLSISDVARECEEGDFSGMELTTTTEEVSAERMIELCENQGSDPSFILGDDDDEYEEQLAELERERAAQNKSALIDGIQDLGTREN